MDRSARTFAVTTLVVLAAMSGRPALSAVGENAEMPRNSASSRFDIAQTATPCRGGYRLIQLVQSRGEPAPGVLVRCSG